MFLKLEVLFQLPYYSFCFKYPFSQVRNSSLFMVYNFVYHKVSQRLFSLEWLQNSYLLVSMSIHFFSSFLLIKYHFAPQQRIKMSFILLHFLLYIGQENLFYIKVIHLQFSLSQQPEILAVVWITGTILRTFIFLTLPETTGVSNKQDISG